MDDPADKIKKMTSFRWKVRESKNIICCNFLERLAYAADAFIDKLESEVS